MVGESEEAVGVPSAPIPGAPGPLSASLARSMLDTAPVGMAITGSDGRLTWANDAISRLTGRSLDQLMGVSIIDFVHPDDIDAKVDAIEALLRGDVERYERIERWLRPDGDVRWVSVSASLARGPDGVALSETVGEEAPYVIRQVVDVTDRHDAETRLQDLSDELVHRNTELERSNEELSQFAYVASHDLSEPLRVVAGHVELLARRYRGRLDDDADRYIEFAVDGCARMRRLIDDLLAFSRAGREGGDPEAVDLEVLAAAAVRSLASLIAETGADITLGPLPTVIGRPTAFAQVITNLIANAVKFGREGQPPVVAVDAVRADDGWTVRIADDGIGIDPRYRERIFRLFQRLHGQGEYAGTGVGLAVCRRVVELRGGRIWAEDSPSGGSRFCFTIPDAMIPDTVTTDTVITDTVEPSP
ncbi:MAG: hypothetical protein NVS3B21_05520 [Acidimicrobiales bacterium]